MSGSMVSRPSRGSTPSCTRLNSSGAAVAQAFRAGRTGRLRLLRGPLRWYWGVKPYLLTTPEGLPVAWCLANPRICEREVAQ